MTESKDPQSIGVTESRQEVLRSTHHISVQTREFLCRKCKVHFEAEILVMVTIDVWVKHLKSIYCPKCHATWRNLSFVNTPEEPA